MSALSLETRVLGALEMLMAVPPHLETGFETGRVLVAVSGGRDSVALAHLLHPRLEIAVAHLDHALRETSGEDAAFVGDLAAGLGVPFTTERVDVAAVAARQKRSLEDAARRVRYAFLTRAAKDLNCSAVLTAHTLEDNAETVLLQLLRGSARATGIPARRGRVLRPLLAVSKRELEVFLTAHGLPWREDESNRDPRLNRNWLRLEVLPLLEARYPGASAALARYAQVSGSEDALLEDLTQAVPSWADWAREPVAVQRRLIRAALEAANVSPDFAHLEALRVGLSAPKVVRVSLPGGVSGVAQSGRVQVFPDAPQAPSLGFPDAFDFSAFPFARLRTREGADRIRLPGGTRKLSDVFIDRKVPRELRDSVAIVAQNSEVLYIGLEPPVLDVRIGTTHDAEAQAMREALSLAREALEHGEVPVGAVVLKRTQSGFDTPRRLEDEPKFKLRTTLGFETVGRGRNRSQASGDMTQHAELEAIREACATLGTPYLTDCTLVVTLEPCAMCLGAALEARVSRIVFGARNPKNGALGGVADLTRHAWNHRFSVRPGVLERQASALLKAFFTGLRDS